MSAPVPVEEFGKFLSAGLLSRDECLAALFSAVRYPMDTKAIEMALGRAERQHEAAAIQRIRAAIAPLIRCHAYRAAIIAQARCANNSRGRLAAIPDAEVVDLVDSDLQAVLKAMRRG